MLNGLFRTTSLGGVYEGVEGCLNIFLQFIDKVDINELAPFTVFLGQGKMPMMMFGLSGAALAIYRTSPKKRRKGKVLMIAGVAKSPALFPVILSPGIFIYVYCTCIVCISCCYGWSFVHADGAASCDYRKY